MNPQTENHPVNPLLSKVKLPGRIFQLPSAGIFYQNGELAPGIENGEVHVHPMTALDEITMKNPDMLFSGKAISEVFRRCIPDVLQPEELFSKDIDALMIFLRAVTYGSEYEIEVNHQCEKGKDHSYVVNIENFITSMKNLDPNLIEQMYSLTLENGQTVRMQPIKYKHVIQILQMNENKQDLTIEDQQKNLITNLLNVIVSVDDIADKNLIAEWLKFISPRMMNHLATTIEESQNWGATTTQEVVCKDCGTPFKIEIPINPISFFFV
jgi:hypothetical protein